MVKIHSHQAKIDKCYLSLCFIVLTGKNEEAELGIIMVLDPFGINLKTNIYNEYLADEIADRIVNKYVAAIGELVENLEKLK